MRIPSHVAIIMDGNGRWAQRKGRPRTFGHIRGARVARQIIECSAQMGLKHLTLFAFSTENWSRPFDEVSLLMRLLQRHLRKELETLQKNNIRFQVIGEIDKLPQVVQAEIRRNIEATKNNTGMILTFALSYGGRQDLVFAIQSMGRDLLLGKIAIDEINEALVGRYLQTKKLPDPDLIIRTSGEQRISNFMLWQAAYTELFFVEKSWPEFTPQDFTEALEQFRTRERRFGKISSPLKNSVVL